MSRKSGMVPLRRTVASLALLLVVLVELVVLTACQGAKEAPAVHRYVLRGEVVALPSANDDAPELLLRHEQIPDFLGIDGQPAPMAAMTMPFPIAPDLSLQGLRLGEPVEVVLEVRWKGSPPYLISRLKELPAGTVLDL